MTLRSFLLLFVVFTTSACANRTMVRSAPDYQSSLERANQAVVLEPKVEVNTIDAFNKYTRMYEYEAYIESILADILIPKLEAKGYKVRALSGREIHNKKLSRPVSELMDGLNDLILELYSTGAWIEEKAFTIDNSLGGACALHDKLNTDLVIMLSFKAHSKTTGAIAKDIMTQVLIGHNSSNNEGLSELSNLKMVVIEAKTNKVLWAHSVNNLASIWDTTRDSFSDAKAADNRKLSVLVDSILKDLPSI